MIGRAEEESLPGTLYRLRIGLQHVQTRNTATLPVSEVSRSLLLEKIIIRDANERNIEIQKMSRHGNANGDVYNV